jgi:hypothetical protein
VRDLVEGYPQVEVVWRKIEPALHLGQVGAHEVQEAVVVGREEHVVLAQHLARHVAEQDAHLETERLSAQLGTGPMVREDPAGERLQQPLQPSKVGRDPLASRHDPRPGAEPRHRQAGELRHE